MSLLAEAELLVSTKRIRCSVGILLAQLPVTERDELIEALDSGVEAKALARALHARDHQVAAETLIRHRRGDCKCP